MQNRLWHPAYYKPEMIPTRIKKNDSTFLQYFKYVCYFCHKYILYTVFICLKLICCQANKMGNKEGVVSKQFANMYDHFTTHAWQSQPSKHNRHRSAIPVLEFPTMQMCFFRNICPSHRIVEKLKN